MFNKNFRKIFIQNDLKKSSPTLGSHSTAKAIFFEEIMEEKIWKFMKDNGVQWYIP